MTYFLDLFFIIFWEFFYLVLWLTIYADLFLISGQMINILLGKHGKHF